MPAPSMSLSIGNERAQSEFDPFGHAESHEIRRAARAAYLGRVGGVWRREREPRGFAFHFGNVPVRPGHQIVTASAIGAGRST